MLFSSITFLFYFLPCILVLYYAFRFSTPLKNLILLTFSLFFYGWGEPVFIFIMLASILINYVLGIVVHGCRKKRKAAKVTLVIMCVANLGILFVFKYLAFTLGAINGLLGVDFLLPQIALPIGISFFTFQAMSYVVDVYRGDAEVQKNPFYLALYISFFPQLIAGPIVRYQTVADQIVGRKESLQKVSIGTCRFMAGFSKKILIANNMAIIADQIYAMNELGPMPMTLAWTGSIAYTLQIFFDFSAYSDMAIGLGLLFGFKFDENFNFPYISQSITEFWRRWHISLGSWFKSYVYFPMGGSRTKSKDKMVRNLIVVWLCTGIWHGAAWTFVLWGILNFVFIFIEKLLDFEEMKVPKFFKHLYTLFVVNLGWVLFRAESIHLCASYINSMFSIKNGFFSAYAWMFTKEYFVFFLAAITLSIPVGKRMNRLTVDGGILPSILQFVYPLLAIGLFVISVSYLVVGSYNPFIYFNF